MEILVKQELKEDEYEKAEHGANQRSGSRGSRRRFLAANDAP